MTFSARAVLWLEVEDSRTRVVVARGEARLGRCSTEEPVQPSDADHWSRITTTQHRATRAKAKRDPALRSTSSALTHTEKAMGETQDAATRKALEEVRATLALNGVVVARAASPLARRVTAEDLGERLLAHVNAHPGQRGEEIAEALGTDTYSMRPSLKRLRFRARAGEPLRRWSPRMRSRSSPRPPHALIDCSRPRSLAWFQLRRSRDTRRDELRLLD